jgi:hypothetical protein
MASESFRAARAQAQREERRAKRRTRREQRLDAAPPYRASIRQALEARGSLTAAEMRTLCRDLCGTPDDPNFLEALKSLQDHGIVVFSSRSLRYVAQSEEDSRAALTVMVRRSRRVSQGGRCDKCRTVTTLLWEYCDSSLGRPALVCSTCKPIVMDASFGPVDVMDTARVKTSAFETKRRRH